MTYGSARDLPAFVEMKRQLTALRFLGLPFSTENRRTVRELRAQVDYLTATVDAFYALLGPRSWVFHDDLAVGDMAVLVAEHRHDPAGAETALIAWYQAEGRLSGMVRRLNSHEGLRARMHLLDFALDDYESERYYAVVQVLISVMDGFVSDLTPASPKGLHARDAEELDAWNSVVGHHLGLASAHETFRKGFRRRNDEPVHELYRNGIVHGMLTNYNNDIVATKAWNRLFAVADWARAVENEHREAAKPPGPTWRELSSQLRANTEAKTALEAFRPVKLSADQPDFTSHPAYQTTTDFLEAWRRRNFGSMSKLLTNSFGAVAPIEVRNDYQSHSLEDFEVLELHHSAAAITAVSVQLRIEGAIHTPVLRWVREGAGGQSAAPNEPGHWRLMRWGYPFMTQDRDA